MKGSTLFISYLLPTMIKLTTSVIPLENVPNTTSQPQTLRPQSKLPVSVTENIVRPPNWSPASTLNLHSVVHRASRGIFFKCKSHHTTLLKTPMAFLTTPRKFQCHYWGLKAIHQKTGMPFWSHPVLIHPAPLKRHFMNIWRTCGIMEFGGDGDQWGWW